MYNFDVIDEIKKQYDVNVLEEYLKNDVGQIVFCFDWKNRIEAEIMVLRGDIRNLGIFEKNRMKIKDFLSMIETDNPISDVYGKRNYISNLYDNLSVLSENNELHVPIRKDGKLFWLCLSIKALTKKDGVNELIYGHVNWFTENTPKAILYYQSKYKDSETGMFSRASLKLHLSKAKETGHSYGIYLDIDNFKRVNDVFGHRQGDRYLKELADRFSLIQRSDELYYRIGGDEFFVYMINSTEEKAYKKAREIIYIIETLNPEGQQVEVSASIGIVPIIGNDFDFEDLIDLGDKTMYKSKNKGKGNISYAREV